MSASRENRRDEVARIIDELHVSWYSSLVRYATRSLSGIHQAEDVVQEAFLLLCRELMRGTRIESPKGWTLSVVRRQIGRQFGDSAAMTSWEDLDDGQHPTVVAESTADDMLSDLLSCLTKREQEVVLLRLEGFRYSEIGVQLGVSLATVKTLLVRALKKIHAHGYTSSGLTESSRKARERKSERPH